MLLYILAILTKLLMVFKLLKSAILNPKNYYSDLMLSKLKIISKPINDPFSFSEGSGHLKVLLRFLSDLFSKELSD